MASILTNQSAIVALQTLRSTNQSLSDVQDQISTGKKVANARDNSAIFAISTVIESDIESFRSINESLNLGQSSVAVGRNAAEQITGLLQETQSLIVSAQEENVDRSKIQTNVSALRDQIVSITNAAQFNGLNLVRGEETVNVLSSLDRAPDGNVSASQIQVNRQNLEISTGSFDAAATAATTLSAPSETDISATAGTDTTPASTTIDLSAVTAGAGETFTFDIGGVSITTAALSGGEDADGVLAALQTAAGSATLPSGISLSFEDSATTGGAPRITVNADATVTTPVAITDVTGSTAGSIGTPADASVDGVTPVATASSALTFSGGTLAANEGFRISLTEGGTTTNFDYVARDGDTINDVARNLQGQIVNAGISGVTVDFTEAADPTTNDATLTLNSTNTGTITVASANTSGGDNTVAGGLANLAAIDVSTAEGAEFALDAIEGLLQTSIDSAAAFGSVERRIEIQSEFVTQLTDSLRIGVGALVDADLEEASARLQSLQVQQQLGTQALSIANQAPQSILALFR